MKIQLLYLKSLGQIFKEIFITSFNQFYVCETPLIKAFKKLNLKCLVIKRFPSTRLSLIEEKLGQIATGKMR